MPPLWGERACVKAPWFEVGGDEPGGRDEANVLPRTFCCGCRLCVWGGWGRVVGMGWGGVRGRGVGQSHEPHTFEKKHQRKTTFQNSG